MKCPHCSVEVHESFDETHIAREKHYWGSVGGSLWTVSHMTCPSCKGAIIRLAAQAHDGGPGIDRFVAFPKSTGRQQAPSEVPAEIADDYHEACAVLKDSPKASAALSRRCLQAVLRTQGYAQKDLAPAIDAVLTAKVLPSAIAGNLDAIRNIGNFAAHPLKDTNTGLILPVEPEEADWNLDVLEELFDYFYVQPAKALAKRNALNAKLQSAGKSPMK